MMHPAINTTKTSAYADMAEKQRYYIRYLVKRPHLAKEKLEKMNSKINRNKAGKVAKGSKDDFERMEQFRAELNAERVRLKTC